MSEQLDLVTLVERLERGVAELRTLQPRVEARAPWPLSDRFGTEPEATWGPPETLAHVAEMLPFWTGEIERILAGTGEAPVPFGRVASDDLRIGVIERDRSLPPRELFSRIDAGTERLGRRLRDLEPTGASSRGVHPTLGEFTVAGVLERFLVRHLEEHVAQLRESLAAG